MNETRMGRADLPPELTLLLSLAAGHIPQTCPKGLDWPRVHALAEKNRLQPQLLRGLKALERQEEGARQVLDALTEDQSRRSLLAMGQVRLLAQLAAALEGEGIPMLSMKGPLLAMELYGNPAMRRSRDLDILVPETHLDRTCALLEGWGFREEIDIFHKTPKRRKLRAQRGEEMHRVYSREGLCVEVHWRLSFRVDQPFEHLWATRREARLMGQTVARLGVMEDLCYLICHASGHGYCRLSWLLDLYLLLNDPKLDLEALLTYMEDQGVAVMLMEVLLLLKRCPGLSLRPVETRRLTLEGAGDGLTIRYAPELEEDVQLAVRLVELVWPLLSEEGEDTGLAGIQHAQLLPTRGEQLGPVGRVLALFRPRKGDLELIDLPDSLYFLYYVIRPLYVLWRKTPFYHPNGGNQRG